MSSNNENIKNLLKITFHKMRLNKTKVINVCAAVLCFYFGFLSNRLPAFTTKDRHLKLLVLVPKEEMGGPASWGRLNFFSLRMAHRHYYGLAQLEHKFKLGMKVLSFW